MALRLGFFEDFLSADTILLHAQLPDGWSDMARFGDLLSSLALANAAPIRVHELDFVERRMGTQVELRAVESGSSIVRVGKSNEFVVSQTADGWLDDAERVAYVARGGNCHNWLLIGEPPGYPSLAFMVSCGESYNDEWWRRYAD